MNATPKATGIEELILADIHRKTGLSFVHLPGINTGDAEVAAAVLPVLQEWLPSVTENNYRRTIYSQFVTPHAHPYIQSLIEWWKTERDPLAVSFLTQALAINARPAEAAQLWQVCKGPLRKPGYFILMAKLATFPSIEREVKETLVEALRDSSLTVGDLQFIAKVNDPRIRKWFEAQVNSGNPGVRALARRVVDRGKKLPKGIEMASGPPDRSAELFSTEVGLEDLKPLLADLARKFQLKIPSALRSCTFLSSLDIDRWVVVRTNWQSKDSFGVWLRMEDIDTIEVVLTKEIEAASPVQ